jgi:hypothetical protein
MTDVSVCAELQDEEGVRKKIKLRSEKDIQEWSYNKGWCGVCALLFCVQHCQVSMEKVESDEDLEKLLKYWQGYVSFTQQHLKLWPIITQGQIHSVLKSVYKLECTPLCKDFIFKIDPDNLIQDKEGRWRVPKHLYDAEKHKNSVVLLKSLPEFYETECVGFILLITDKFNHVVAFMTNGKKEGVFFYDNTGDSRHFKTWFEEKQDYVVIDIYRVTRD